MHGLSSCAKGVRSMLLLKLYIYRYLNRVHPSRGSNARPDATSRSCGYRAGSLLSHRSKPKGRDLHVDSPTDLFSRLHLQACATEEMFPWLRGPLSPLRGLRLLQLCGDTLPLCATWRSPLHLVERFDSLFFDSCNWDPAALPQQMPVSVGNHVQQDP